MNQINYAIFEEFNGIDKICCEMLSVKTGGVTAYLGFMDKVSLLECNNIDNWYETRRMLIRTRDLRNKMSHEPGAFDYVDGTEEDLEWLRKFHQKLLSCEDPICLLRKKREERANPKRKKENHNNDESEGGLLDKETYKLLIDEVSPNEEKEDKDIEKTINENTDSKSDKKGGCLTAFIIMLVILIVSIVLIFAGGHLVISWIYGGF